jgi:16S rRNA U1498 N3-methylase RsmE
MSGEDGMKNSILRTLVRAAAIQRGRARIPDVRKANTSDNSPQSLPYGADRQPIADCGKSS